MNEDTKWLLKLLHEGIPDYYSAIEALIKYVDELEKRIERLESECGKIVSKE